MDCKANFYGQLRHHTTKLKHTLTNIEAKIMNMVLINLNSLL